MGCGSSVEEVVNPDQVDASHFQFAKVVGKGGFGKVNAAMRAEDPTQLVAIKRIAKRRVLNPGLRESVWTERDVMSRVQSPFTLKLHHSFQDNDELYLVMPFFRGGDLDYYMEVHGPLDEDKARFYAAEIVLGMEELHSLNILYRDLKPQNCLLQDTGHLAISDYGLCVVLKEETGWKAKGTSGTTGFQAPEVLSGGYYSYSVDFFSFGVTLYVLLTRYYRMFGKSGDQFNRTIDFSTMSERAADLIQQLLIHDPEKRLGCAKVSAKEMEARIAAEEERLAALGERKTGNGGVLLEGKGDGRIGSDSITAITPRPHDDGDSTTGTPTAAATATTTTGAATPNAVTLTFPLLASDGTTSKRRSVEKKTASDDHQPIELAPKDDTTITSPNTVTIAPATVTDDEKKDADTDASSSAAASTLPTVAPAAATVKPSGSSDTIAASGDTPVTAPAPVTEKKLKPSAAAAASVTTPVPLAQTPRRPSTLSGYQMLTGWAAVKAHPFFDGIDWTALKAGTLTPPYIPQLKENQAHCSNRHSLVEHFELDKVEEKPLTSEQQALFVGFEFNTKVTPREQWAEYTPADEKKRKKAEDAKAKKDAAKKK